VVLARKKDTGRLYALKIMKKHRIFKEKKLKPIMSERNIMEMLNTKHPFIIKLHWAFQSVRLFMNKILLRLMNCSSLWMCAQAVNYFIT
jgi:hypothetical protein